MEVHAHTHTAKWAHYFWEFLMLFLAVFCGFLAEYQLEHKIERDRANELAKSFYEELKTDSANAIVKVQNRLKLEKGIKYLIKYFKNGDLSNVPKEFVLSFQYGINFRSPSVFEPRTVILDQLKNSGSLRYFKNDRLQQLIGDLTVAIKNIYDRQELESQQRVAFLNPLIIKHYDFDFDARLRENDKSILVEIEKYELSSDSIPYQFKGIDKLDRENIRSTLSFYGSNLISSTRKTFIQKYIDLNAELLKELRKEYHIKN